MNLSPHDTLLTTWALDREIVLMKVLPAPRPAVYAAWANADSFAQWFGPDGFTTEVQEWSFQEGAISRFTMTAADGTVYTNRYLYVEIVPEQRLTMIHGSDLDDDPGRFGMTVTFDEQQDGKTIITMRQLHPHPEQRAAVIGFGAVEMGLQTLQKLADFLASH